VNLGPIGAQFGLHGQALPADALVTSYVAREALSEPYEVTVHFCTDDAAFRVESCLRTRILLEVAGHSGTPHYFDGVVDEAEFVKVVGKMLHFRVRLRPSLAALALRVDSRIFQEQSVVDIAKALLAEAGVEHVEYRLTGTHSPREYVVQYRESTLNFISRLFEDEGIFYFFKHDENGHTLVIADAVAIFQNHDLVGEPVPLSLGQSAIAAGEPLLRFARRRSLRTTSVSLRDYQFQRPVDPVMGDIVTPDAWPMPHFDYPGGFGDVEQGKRTATARMSQLRHDADFVSGRTREAALAVGRSIAVDGSSEEELGGEFVVTRLVTAGRQALGAEQAQNVACEHTFSAVPSGSAYLPPRRARRPKIRGVQTAVVTGAVQDAQSIHTDKYGRIKVRFHWDRVGQFDDKSSCWIRVVQVALGGSMILPRVGWEVSVAFLDGDPDRPLVLGRVYNGEKTPPMALPGSAASSSLKSMSSPGGAGSNELTMGDAGGSQGFSIKAQKDLNMSTGYDQTEEVVVDDEHHVNANLSRSVKVDDQATIGANQTFDVGAHAMTKITGTQSVDVGANEQFDAKGNFLEKITGDRSYKVGGNVLTIDNGEQRTLTGNYTRTVGSMELAAAVESITENILQASSSTAGAVRVYITGGNVGEVVAAAKARTVAGAEVQVVKGNVSVESDGAATHIVGGVHNQKVTGDLVIKGQKITMLGGTAKFKAGSSELSLAGGPIKLKGGKIVVKAALVKKSGDMKVGG
jgi:type VI secretion system secreted protein VgrG